MLMSEDEFRRFVAMMEKADVVTIDTEGTSLDVKRNPANYFTMGLAIAFRFGGVLYSDYFAFRHKDINCSSEWLDKFRQILPSKMLVMHNSKHDISALSDLGIRVNQFYDTLVLAHMVNENHFSYELNYLSQQYSGHPKSMPEIMKLTIQVAGWEWIPAEQMRYYSANDAAITHELFEKLRDELVKQKMWDLWPEQQEFIKVIDSMETRGVRIDQDLSFRELIKGQARMEEIKSELGLNPGSPKELAQLLLEELGLPIVGLTPAGKPCFDKKAMVEYDALLSQMEDSRAGLVKEYRGWQKTTSSNYKPYLDLVSPDGRLRPNYKLHGTKTSRLSCEKPNLQQIPRVSTNEWNGKLKQAFIPGDGAKLFEADFSQLELRLAAAYANETKLLEVLADQERDIFSEMAADLKWPRQNVKTVTYLRLYGGGYSKIMSAFGVSESEAIGIRDEFSDKYRRLGAVSRQAAAKCKARGYVQLWTGRRRHFDNPEQQAHKAFNSVIQGGAAEVVKKAIIKLDREVCDDNCKMLLQIHDSVVFEIAEGFENKYQSLIQEVMNESEFDLNNVRFFTDWHEWGK